MSDTPSNQPKALHQADEFFVGYAPQLPTALGGWIRRVVLGLLVLSGVLALLLVFGQQPFYPSFFEYGQTRSFAGVIKGYPYPALLVERPSSTGYSRYHLVASGKFGAQDIVRDWDNQPVRLQGTLIYRDGQTMIELVDGSIEKTTTATSIELLNAPPVNLGQHQLTGEIIDSKCFLGVMNPGNLKPHKACAIRCISGGIPPVLVVNDSQGQTRYFMLVSAAGKTVNQQVLPMVAQPVRITGRVVQYGDVLVLKADPQTYELLD